MRPIIAPATYQDQGCLKNSNIIIVYSGANFGLNKMPVGDFCHTACISYLLFLINWFFFVLAFKQTKHQCTD